MDANTKNYLNQVSEVLVKRIYINYLILFTVAGLLTWVVLHYGTDWFKNDDGTTLVWHQAAVAGGVALLVAITAFFTQML